MRSLLIVDHCHEPLLWIEELEIDEKYSDVPSMTEVRKERLVSLGFRIWYMDLGRIVDKTWWPRENIGGRGRPV